MVKPNTEALAPTRYYLLAQDASGQVRAVEAEKVANPGGAASFRMKPGAQVSQSDAVSDKKLNDFSRLFEGVAGASGAFHTPRLQGGSLAPMEAGSQPIVLTEAELSVIRHKDAKGNDIPERFRPAYFEKMEAGKRAFEQGALEAAAARARDADVRRLAALQQDAAIDEQRLSNREQLLELNGRSAGGSLVDMRAMQAKTQQLRESLAARKEAAQQRMVALRETETREQMVAAYDTPKHRAEAVAVRQATYKAHGIPDSPLEASALAANPAPAPASPRANQLAAGADSASPNPASARGAEGGFFSALLAGLMAILGVGGEAEARETPPAPKEPPAPAPVPARAESARSTLGSLPAPAPVASAPQTGRAAAPKR